jgi:hypothetical protein
VEQATIGAQAKLNQKNNTNQTEAPSVSGNTDSLVDQSSASDFIGVALNAAGLTSNSDEMDTTSTSFTVSAYSLYAAAKRHDPLDPAFYNTNSEWRKLSFTVGWEFPEEDGAASGERAIIFGTKYLIWNRRDATHPAYQGKWRELEKAALRVTKADVKISNEVETFVLNTLSGTDNAGDPKRTQLEGRLLRDFQSVLKELGDGHLLGAIDEIIKGNISASVDFLFQNQELINSVRNGPQFSIAYLSKLRKEDGTDEYRLQAILDYGIPKLTNLNVSMNASFDYKNNKMLGGDERGGRFAAEGKYQVRDTKLDEKKEPITISFGGEGQWMNGCPPTYRTQVKITIPLINGINLPISGTWASRTDLIDESDVRGRVGFTFDLAKLAAGFRSLVPTN